MSENKKNRIADGSDENRQPQSAGEGKDSSSARTESTQGTHTGNGDFRERDGERQEGGAGCESGGQGESGNARHPSHDELVQKKIICSLAYVFGILFFLPLAIYPNDDFAKFHANQSLVVLLVSVIGGAVFGLLSAIPAIGVIFAVVASVFSVVMLVACILGILGVVRAEKYELPVLGKIRIIK